MRLAARRRVGGKTVATVFLAILLSVLCATVAGAQGSPEQPPEEQPPGPLDPIAERSDQYTPKPAGTKETLKYWYGPYVVPPGWDANRLDLNVPVPEGMVLSIEPGLRMADTMEEPSHQVAHIHHAHWFTLHPGSETDNYFGGNADWMFGNGDEETKADFQERTAADPKGPVYGSHIDASEPGPVIYMLHNKTAEAFVAYIALDITFIHGSPEELSAARQRARVPRHHRRPLRPHLRRPARPELEGRHLRAARGRPEGLHRVDLAGRRDADRHRQPRPSRRPAGDHARTTAPRRTRAPTRATATAAPSCSNRTCSTTTASSSARTTRPRSRTRPGGRRSTRATGSGSPASTRTRSTPGTRR